MGPYVAHIPAWFSTRKAAQVTAFFAQKAGGSINVLRATKLIYLADRLSMKHRDRPITGDNFVSMPFGPVNTYTYSYMNGEAAERKEEWEEFIGERSGYDIPLARQNMRNEDLDELSRGDINLLNATWDEFEDIDRFDLAEWTHNFCPEWVNPYGSSLPILFSTVFKKLDKNEPLELEEEIQAERALRLQLQG